jgi:IS30 family transposase
MVSRQSKSVIAVMVEKKSRFVLLEKLLRKASLNFSGAIHSRLIDYPRHLRRTITYDNGPENVDHGIINKCLYRSLAHVLHFLVEFSILFDP